MATKITKGGPRRIVHAPNAGNINTAQPVNAHPVSPVKPKVGKSGTPNPTPLFVSAGHFTVNVHNNIARVSAPGRSPVRPLTPFQGASTPSGNPVVNYRTKVGIAQDTPDIKGTGTSLLSSTVLPGNAKRRGPQPVNSLMPYNRKLQNGGQAYLPGYKRSKMGRAG